MKKMFAVAVLGLFLPAFCCAQYTPSKAQYEKLAKQKAKILRLQVEIARLQAESQFELANLERACREVSLNNRWPADVMCNPQSLTFFTPPPLPQPAVPTPADGTKKKD